jgi:hypothetical protein
MKCESVGMVLSEQIELAVTASHWSSFKIKCRADCVFLVRWNLSNVFSGLVYNIGLLFYYYAVLVCIHEVNACREDNVRASVRLSACFISEATERILKKFCNFEAYTEKLDKLNCGSYRLNIASVLHKSELTIFSRTAHRSKCRFMI